MAVSYAKGPKTAEERKRKRKIKGGGSPLETEIRKGRESPLSETIIFREEKYPYFSLDNSKGMFLKTTSNEVTRSPFVIGLAGDRTFLFSYKINDARKKIHIPLNLFGQSTYTKGEGTHLSNNSHNKNVME